jgi:LPS-assembly lipoprotein
MRRGLWVTLIAVILSGCGWHLQAVRPLSAELLPVYLQLTDTHSVFARSLQQGLESAGIETTRDLARAGSVLSVTQDKSTRQISSVSAFNQPQQYQIDYQVEYRFERHDKAGQSVSGVTATQLIPSQMISASRTMSYDVTLALAKDREARAIEELLAEQLTQQILRRLNYLPAATAPAQ